MALSPYILDYLLEHPFEKNYLEIGVFDGGVISEVAKHYQDKICYGIDPFIEDGCTSHISGCQTGENMSLRKENTYKACDSLKNVRIYEVKSDDFFKRLTDEQVKELNIGCVVVDGAHDAESVKNDVHLALKLMGPGGIVVFDDWQMDSVRETVTAELPGAELVYSDDNVFRVYKVLAQLNITT
jgi:hypothetical protein